jgi:2-phospho-L-lactate guanylyltransferase
MTLSAEHVWAVVPIKCFAQAKARLAPALAPADRQRLAVAMADDVLGAIRASGVADRLCLLSDQTSAATDELAARHGALALLDREVAATPGLNAAIGGVAAMANRYGADALLVVHADLPLLTADALRQLLQTWRALRGAQRVVLTRSKDGGTSLLLAEHPHDFTYRFGPDSHARHLDECSRRRCMTTSAGLHSALLDIDTPDDLDRLRQAARSGPCGAHTAAMVGELSLLSATAAITEASP